MRLYLMPSYSTGTTDADRLAFRFASSGSKSEIVVPSSTRRISYRFFPHFRRTEHSLRFCGIFYKDNTTLKTIFEYFI